MIKDYLYRKTPKITLLVTQINTYRDLFDKLPKLPQVQENLQRRTMFKSALYSARIEGNSLKLAEIEEELETYALEQIVDSLLPRRAEILFMIREYQMMTFDQIRRRFLSVNTRTIHYDLQDLLRKEVIRKLGKTRAVVYTPK